LGCTFGKLPLGKIPMGSCHLGRYPWEVAAWEKAFGKVPNISLSYLWQTFLYVILSMVMINIFYYLFGKLLYACHLENEVWKLKFKKIEIESKFIISQSFLEVQIR